MGHQTVGLWSKNTMSKVILTPELREKLNGLNEPVEFCDESGKTVKSADKRVGRS
jgi:hypothetical protein